MSRMDIPAHPEQAVLDPEIKQAVSFNDRGLVPAVVQDVHTGRVLMLAWMDDKALAYTLATGQATYWSRSRGEYWIKGATSGHYQKVRTAELDCDGDTVLVQVEQTGAACHTGRFSCFESVTLLDDTGDSATAG